LFFALISPFLYAIRYSRSSFAESGGGNELALERCSAKNKRLDKELSTTSIIIKSPYKIYA
jgi:hypothetical protein